MNYGAAPERIETRVFSELPSHFRNRRAADDVAGGRWQGGAPMDSLIEGPCFDGHGNLFLVDIPNGRILRVTAAGDWSVVIEYGRRAERTAEALRRHVRHCRLQKRAAAPGCDRRQDHATCDPLSQRALQGTQRCDRRPQRRYLFYRSRPVRPAFPPPDGSFGSARTGQLDCLLSNGPSPNGLVLSADEKILFVAMTRGQCGLAASFVRRRHHGQGRTLHAISRRGRTGRHGARCRRQHLRRPCFARSCLRSQTSTAISSR